MKTLNTLLNEYLVLRRTMGFSLVRSEFELRNFLKFMKKKKSSLLKNTLSIQWATNAGMAKGNSGPSRLEIIIQFAKYAKSENAHHEVPQKMSLPQKSKHKKKPYIFTEQEVITLMELTKSKNGVIGSHTYECLIGLLYCTGMRVGEIIQLNLKDLKLSENKLVVQKDKSGGSREILLDKSTVDVLKKYKTIRNNKFPNNKDDSFFVSGSGRRLHYNNISPYIQKLLKKSGLYTAKVKPTIHDLRHTFAINTIQRWHLENKNVESKISILSTYLGHVSPSSTYWYLTATQELMSCASKRLDKKMEKLI